MKGSAMKPLRILLAPLLRVRHRRRRPRPIRRWIRPVLARSLPAAVGKVAAVTTRWMASSANTLWVGRHHRAVSSTSFPGAMDRPRRHLPPHQHRPGRRRVPTPRGPTATPTQDAHPDSHAETGHSSAIYHLRSRLPGCESGDESARLDPRRRTPAKYPSRRDRACSCLTSQAPP